MKQLFPDIRERFLKSGSKDIARLLEAIDIAVKALDNIKLSPCSLSSDLIVDMKGTATDARSRLEELSRGQP